MKQLNKKNKMEQQTKDNIALSIFSGAISGVVMWVYTKNIKQAAVSFGTCAAATFGLLAIKKAIPNKKPTKKVTTQSEEPLMLTGKNGANTYTTEMIKKIFENAAKDDYKLWSDAEWKKLEDIFATVDKIKSEKPHLSKSDIMKGMNVSNQQFLVDLFERALKA